MDTSYEFHKAFSFSEIHRERIGQLINYLALHINGLYCTRLIKLLYIIDETAVLKLGLPITWMTYYVYKMGPVPEKLWFSIKEGNKEFGEYFDVHTEVNKHNSDHEARFRISPISKEDPTELSKNERKIVDSVIDEFGNQSVEKLIKFLHRTDSLWYQIVQRNAIDFKQSLSTTLEIDLSALIVDNENGLAIFKDTRKEIDFLESLTK